MGIRVAAYCRVSTDQEEQKTSIITQKEAFEQIIRQHADWELAEIYVDEGLTGTSTQKRREFQRMMRDCEAGKIDRILTKSISRFARNTVDTLTYVRRLREMGIFVLFEKEHLDTGSATSELILTILAAVAQEESRSISENIKWGNRKRYEEGKCKWTPIFGYERGYVVVAEEAQVVRRAFDMYASGQSLNAICAQLNRENVLHRGRIWRPKSLSELLHNEKYAGDIVMQKRYTTDYLTRKQVENDGSIVPRYLYRAHHAPIVDRHVFEVVQKIMAMKDTHQGSTQYPYFGLLFCPLCGAAMYRLKNQSRKGAAVWTCGGKCQPYAFREEIIDRALREALTTLDDKTAAVRKWKERRMDKIEYIMLDELVENIAFVNWETLRITWKGGHVSKVPLRMEKPTDHPLPRVCLERLGGASGMVKTSMQCSVEKSGRLIAAMRVEAGREVVGKYTRPRIHAATDRARRA